MENMSKAPYYLEKARAGYRMGAGVIQDHMMHDGLWDIVNDFHMGISNDLCSEKYNVSREDQDQYAAESYRRTLGAIGAQASAGLDMKYVLVAPILAIPKVLQKEGLSRDEIDLFEVNEAFSGSTVAVLRELNLDPAKVNVNGGSVALGHPIGASGCRVLVTLLHEMIKQNKKTGLASLCLGGGEAVAMIVKR
jgi:acetyl-CoA acetyltransferase